jgi:hypothetical protein
MEETQITGDLAEVLRAESKRFAGEEGTLQKAMEKFIEMGLDTKSSYGLPMTDTIGKTFHEQLQCKRS